MSKKKDDKVLRSQLEALDLPELANTIAAYEEFGWKINHDAADGRIGGSVGGTLVKIRAVVQVVAQVFAEKTGIDVSDSAAMRSKIREELGKFDAMVAARWQSISKVGAVFSITGSHGRLAKDITDLFETLAVYDTTMVGPDEFVLARTRGGGEFTLFDNRDAVDLKVEDKLPMYTRDKTFLRSTGHAEFPLKYEEGHDIRDTGAVFKYQGDKKDPRNGIWETFYHYLCVPGHSWHQVIIARNREEGKVAEFTATDLDKIEVLNLPSRFVKRTRCGTATPLLTVG